MQLSVPASHAKSGLYADRDSARYWSYLLLLLLLLHAALLVTHARWTEIFAALAP
jgi:hypothetical protein